MKFTALASSSAGNAYIVEDGRTKLLIECGIPYRRLQKLTGFGLAGICGCLLSHEHHDHAKCHMELVKGGIPVYASTGTAQALDCDLLCEI
ncbi:MAG: MBL fold metallo-hydrolase, partial [Pseudoflavonifractor sp.]